MLTTTESRPSLPSSPPSGGSGCTCATCQEVAARVERVRSRWAAEQRSWREAAPPSPSLAGETDEFLVRLQGLLTRLQQSRSLLSDEQIQRGYAGALDRDRAAAALAADLWARRRRDLEALVAAHRQATLGEVAQILDETFPGNEIAAAFAQDDPLQLG